MKPHRWFRFSLRTFFVVLTLFGVWLGMQWKWIRDRRAYLAEHPRALSAPRSTDTPASAPGALGLFGEHSVTRLNVIADDWVVRRKNRQSCPQAIAARKLFPESIIMVGTTSNMLADTWWPGKPFGWYPPGTTGGPKEYCHTD